MIVMDVASAGRGRVLRLGVNKTCLKNNNQARFSVCYGLRPFLAVK